MRRVSEEVMESYPGASALVRGLLVLARASKSGVLTVRTRGQLARVAIRDGHVVAIRTLPDDRDGVGDALRAMGAWDEAAAGAAPEIQPGEPLGTWAVRVGATSASALSHALRKQLQRRMLRLFTFDPPELRLVAGRSDVGWPELPEPPTTAELILSALRDRSADKALWLVRRRLGNGVLVLAPLGRELLRDAALWPEEASLRPLLERGASVDALVAASRGNARAQRLLYALSCVGAVTPPPPRGRYATLLLKSRQLERAARSSELLDLASRRGGPAARRALRRLANEVHPDSFPNAAPSIRATSQRVMAALVEAQRELS